MAEASLVNHERFPGRDVLKSALVKKWPRFEASFDACAARACAAVLFLELSLAVVLLVSFGV